MLLSPGSEQLDQGAGHASHRPAQHQGCSAAPASCRQSLALLHPPAVTGPPSIACRLAMARSAFICCFALLEVL